MSKVVTTTVLPRDGWDTLNIGAAGDTVAIAGDSLNTNVLQDAGGNNIFTSSSGTVSSTALQGSLQLLSTQTASNSASVSFTTQLTSTYDVYIFKFINIHPSTDGNIFQFNASTDGGSNYNVNKTTTFFYATHKENDATPELSYSTAHDVANGTGYQPLSINLGNDNDQSCAGELHLFSPSSTTYVKHFYSTSSTYATSGGVENENNNFSAGYFNTTTALNAVSFQISSGNIDAGIIKMYGISKT